METSLEVQLDDLTGKHGDGELNPLERLQVSEDEDKVIADGTSHADQWVDFVFHSEVGMDLETPQVAARHFELAMFRQQGTTAKITDRGGTAYSNRFRGESESNNSTTSLRPRGRCDRPASARDDVDRAKQAV